MKQGYTLRMTRQPDAREIRGQLMRNGVPVSLSMTSRYRWLLLLKARARVRHLEARREYEANR